MTGMDDAIFFSIWFTAGITMMGLISGGFRVITRRTFWR
jgi:hypothetical protein